MKRLIAVLLATCACALAQDFVVTRDITLSGSGEAVTIQTPTSNARRVQVQKVFVRCLSACDISIERNGTNATTSASTPKAINPALANAAKTLGFVGADTGVGTVVGIDSLPSGGFTIFNMAGIFLTRATTTAVPINTTVRIGSMTGRVLIEIYFNESPIS